MSAAMHAAMHAAMRTVVGGLRRLLGAPGLWLGSWGLMLVIAWSAGAHVEVVVSALLGPFDALDPDAMVFAVIDLMRLHPAAGAGFSMAVLGGTVTSALAWVVLSPLVIARLAGHRSAEALGSRALAKVPAVVVQSLWHGLLRAVLMLAVVMAARSLPPLALAIAAGLAWLCAGVALDATRVAVVEHDAAPWHPRTAWRGFVRVLRRPRLLIPGVLLGLGQLATSATILWVGLAGFGGGSPWIPRILALVSLGLGLWRIGIVVEDAAADA
ncbi:hypothetical protein [Paraliomyxa miuraensis]|uniref:hypothetical protein n=1 Tax=Paraliomyxa miuraensis TaxID=376150 RepID=UPI00225A00C5|nr:hypothetical protein [Paraliomyxa miuraensis]MCX4240067.1 hypothetical protein [Paraliomyxa miuraensis]